MMEVTVSCPAEINRKRKFQTELLGMPLPKHVCLGHILECDSSSHFITQLKVDSTIFTRGSESDPELAKGSNSFQTDADSSMSACDGDNTTILECKKACISSEACTSSSSWGGATSPGMDLYSLESRSSMTSNCNKSESVSISERLDCPCNENFLEFRNNADCSCSEDRDDGMEYCSDKELEDLLYSNGIDPKNYVFSSGRLTDTQDTEDGARKLTIDKEFEEYFSMLMM